jgi:hypothetical protein
MNLQYGGRYTAELYATPREREWMFVCLVLRQNTIGYLTRNEIREHGKRYVIYIRPEHLDRAAEIVEERLIDYEDRCMDAGISCWG